MTTTTYQTMTFKGGLIKEIQEWAYIYFVKFIKGSPMFVKKSELDLTRNDIFDRAIKAYQQGKLKVSLKLWNQALTKQYKNNALAWENQARILQDLQLWAQSKQSLLKAIELNPKSDTAKKLLEKATHYIASASYFQKKPLSMIELKEKEKNVGILFQLNDFTWAFKSETSCLFFAYFLPSLTDLQENIKTLIYSKHIVQNIIKSKITNFKVLEVTKKCTIFLNSKEKWINVLY